MQTTISVYRTGVLNDVLVEAMAMQQPPSDKGQTA